MYFQKFFFSNLTKAEKCELTEKSANYRKRCKLNKKVKIKGEKWKLKKENATERRKLETKEKRCKRQPKEKTGNYTFMRKVQTKGEKRKPKGEKMQNLKGAAFALP